MRLGEHAGKAPPPGAVTRRHLLSEVAPLVRDLPCCCGQPQPPPRRTYFRAIEGVTPSRRLIVHASKILVDRTAWVWALTEASQLGMTAVANRPSSQHGLRQQSLAPQGHQASSVQVLRMQCPQSHQSVTEPSDRGGRATDSTAFLVMIAAVTRACGTALRPRG
jgi:hypothetical protein